MIGHVLRAYPEYAGIVVDADGADAIVAFERLLLLRRVSRGNRKLAMACCLLLAWKMNESRDAMLADSEGGGGGASGGGGGGGGADDTPYGDAPEALLSLGSGWV